MKKITYTIMLFVLSISLNAQLCIGDFTFTTQAEIDQFIIDNPTCTTIDGSVIISDENGGAALNCNAFQNIENITGDLFIYIWAFQTVSFTGFSNLQSVGVVHF